MAEAKTSEYTWGTGRRKSAVARVRIKPGKGAFFVNEKELKKYFKRERDQLDALSPLKVTKNLGKFDVYCKVNGGGDAGQAGAVVLGLARAVMKYDVTAKEALQEAGFLTRDSRMKERKKPGQRGARARFQFSKR